MNETALWRRIQSYLRHPPSQALEVHVNGRRGALAFSIWRAGQQVAERVFERLQGDCAASRGTLALTLALALEQLDTRSAGATTLDSPLRAAERAPSPVHDPSGALREDSEDTTPLASGRAEPAKLASRPAADVEADRPSATARDSPAAPLAETPVARTGLRGGARALFGVLPRGAGVLAAGLELPLRGSGTWQLTGLASLAQRSELAGGTLVAALYGGEALACAHVALGSLRATACGGAAAAGVHGRGDGFMPASSSVRAWIAMLGRVGLRWFVAPLASLELSASAHVSLTRPRWRVLGSSSPDAVSGVAGGALGLDLCVSLP